MKRCCDCWKILGCILGLAAIAAGVTAAILYFKKKNSCCCLCECECGDEDGCVPECDEPAEVIEGVFDETDDAPAEPQADIPAEDTDKE